MFHPSDESEDNDASPSNGSLCSHCYNAHEYFLPRFDSLKRRRILPVSPEPRDHTRFPLFPLYERSSPVDSASTVSTIAYESRLIQLHSIEFAGDRALKHHRIPQVFAGTNRVLEDSTHDFRERNALFQHRIALFLATYAQPTVEYGARAGQLVSVRCADYVLSRV